MYTLQWKTWPICHTLSTLDLHRVPDHTSQVVHVGKFSLVPTRSKYDHTPGRSLDDQRQTGPVVVLGHLIPPPSRQPGSRGERFRPSGYTATSVYWAHISACDRYVQCLLTGASPSVLNLGGADFSHHTPRPSQPTVSTFHLRAPSGLGLSIQSLTKDLEREETLNLMSGSLHSTSTVSYHLSIACANGNH
jgi:hypothetical protein